MLESVLDRFAPDPTRCHVCGRSRRITDIVPHFMEGNYRQACIECLEELKGALAETSMGCARCRAVLLQIDDLLLAHHTNARRRLRQVTASHAPNCPRAGI